MDHCGCDLQTHDGGMNTGVAVTESTTQKMTFGFALPQRVLPDDDSIHAVPAVARDAEAAGFTALWTTESPGEANFEPLVLLSYAAAVTSRVKLAVGIINLPMHVPVRLAQELSTLDILSGGRLLLGIAVGGHRDQYGAFGLTEQNRLRRFEHARTVLNELLEHGEVSYEGPEWTIGDEVKNLPSLQRPRPETWFGAAAEPGVRRAAREADGWIGGGAASHEQFCAQLKILKDELTSTNRDVSSFSIAKRIYVVLDTIDGVNRDRMYRWYEVNYNNPEMADSTAIFGDSTAVRERIEEYVSLGVTHVVLNPILDYKAHLDVLATDIIPAFT